MTEKPRMADRISVHRSGNTAHVLIDGEAFPWWIDRGSIHMNVNPDDVPSITITIIANTVTAVDELSTKQPRA